MSDENDDELEVEVPEDEDIPESVEIVYRKADNYQLLPATGVRGGVQLQNNMKVDFFVDYSEDPESETFEVTESGIGEQLDISGGGRIIREKQVGISLRQDRALSVAGWMISSLLGPSVTEEDIIDLVRSEYPERFASEEGS